MPPSGMPGAGGAGPIIVVAPATFLTNFLLTENPISESGKWVNTGLDWTVVKTASGVASGTQDGSTTPPFPDSYAMYTGNVGYNYRVEGTVHLASGITTRFLEIEILLRWQQHAHFATGYELTMAKDSEYDGAGAWPSDGSLGTNGNQYRNLVPAQPAHSAIGIADGDIFYGQIVGTTITAGVIRSGVDHQMYSVTDTDPDARLTGQPGIGFFRDDNTGVAGNPADNAKFGFSQIKIIPL